MVQSPNSFLVLLCLACAPAGATELYKTVGPNGGVEFSDLKPHGDPRQMPGTLVEQDPVNEERLRSSDAAVQRANARVDLAEREFAIARRPVWMERVPGFLGVARRTRPDIERIAFYGRNVLEAQRVLLDVLQQRRSAAVHGPLTASYEAPVSRP